MRCDFGPSSRDSVTSIGGQARLRFRGTGSPSLGCHDERDFPHFMSNSAVKLLSLGVITGCGVIAFAVAQGDAQRICAIFLLVAAVWFVAHCHKMND